MDDPFFEAFMKRRGGGSSSRRSKGSGDPYFDSFIASMAERRKRQKTEFASKQAAAQAQQDYKAGSQQEDGAKTPSFFEGVAGFAGDVAANFAKAYEVLGEGGAEAAAEVTGVNQAERDRQAETQKRDMEMIRRLGEEMRKTKDPKKKARIKEAIRKIAKIGDEQTGKFQARQQEIVDRADVEQNLGALGTVGLDVVSGGTAGALLRGGKAAQIAGKFIGPTGVRQGAASGAALGGLYGLTGTALFDDDDSAKVEDYLINMGIGTVAGGALGTALPLVGKFAHSKPVQKLDQAVSKMSSDAFNKLLAHTPGQKVRDTLIKAQTKIQNSTAPINARINQLQRQGRITENQAKIMKSDIQTARYSIAGRAESWSKNNPNMVRLMAPVGGKQLDGRVAKDLSRYLNAKNELNLLNIDKKRGIKQVRGRQAQLERTIRELETPDFKERYAADIAVNRDLTNLLVDEGLVTPQQAVAWARGNKNYIHIQRHVENLSEARLHGGRTPVSRGSTKAELRRSGSTKDAEDAVKTLQKRVNDVMQEIYSNQAAKGFVDTLRKAGDTDTIIKQLRDADDVALRQDLRDALRFSRPLKKALARFDKSQTKYIIKIQRELEELNRLGLKESLAKPDPVIAAKLADPGAKMTKKELKATLENIIQNTDTATLKMIRKKIARRDPKLAKAIDDLQDIQSQLKSVNAERLQQWNQARQLKDEAAKGRPTISYYRNGIKETFETTPEIEAAAKRLNAVTMGAVGRVLSAPVRFAQTTITGALNPLWVVKALPRDMVEGFNLSRNAAQTHSPANVIKSFVESAKDDDLHKLFMSYEKGASSIIDLTRGTQQAAQQMREISRAQLPPLSRTAQAANVFKHPSDAWHVVQEASKWHEYALKSQNFRGTYNKLIKEGVPEDDAVKIALYEARNATGNLLEQGDWTKPFQSAFMFFNPTIQGGASLMRAFKERPASTSAKVLLSVQMPSVVTAAWNLSDPRRAEIWTSLSPEERENYWVWVLPGSEKTDGKWQTIKIPKPPGVGALGNVVERSMMELYGVDPGHYEQSYVSMLKAMGSPFDFSSPNAFVGSATPFGMRLPAEMVANYNFRTGEPIVPEWMKENNPDEPFKQHWDDTSKTYIQLGKMLGISPLIVQHFAEQSSGEFGRNVTWLSDLGAEALGLEEGGTGGRSIVESATRSYYGSYGSEHKKEFNDRLTRAINNKKDISKEITAAVQAKDYARASQLARDFNNALRELRQYVGSKQTTIELTPKQRELLDKELAFPMNGDALSEESIRARQRN